MMPSLSASFRWGASFVAGKNAKMPIYILAEEDLRLLQSFRKYTVYGEFL